MITLILLSVVLPAQGEPLEFHLLTSHHYPENIGILTVTKGDRVSAVSFEAVATATHPEKVCQFMGYDTTRSSFMYADNILAGIPSSDIKDLPRALSSYSCPDDAVNATDCKWSWEKDWSYYSPVAVVMCGKRHDGIVQIDNLVLLTDREGDIDLGNPGAAAVYFSNENGDHFASVLCHVDDSAADLACQYLGYDRAAYKTSNHFEVLSRNYTQYFHILVDSVTCEGARSVDDCRVNLGGGESSCSEGEEVVVYCEKRDDNYKLDDMHFVAGKGSELSGADMGIPKVLVSSADAHKSGLVYQVNHRAMQLACQFMGYKNVTKYDFNYDFKYASKDGIRNAGYAVESIYCPDYAKEFEECRVEFAGEKYLEPGSEVVFACGNGEDEDNYELGYAYLLTITLGSDVSITNPGVVYVYLLPTEYFGFVYKANHRAMELICQVSGYPGLKSYGYNENFEFAYEELVDSVGYVIDEVECPENAQNFNECEVRLSDPREKRAPGHELVLHCGDYELDKIRLVAGSGYELNDADMGIPKVYLSSAEGHKSGLVYQVNHRAMQLACQFMGYKNVTKYHLNTDFEYASRDGIMNAGYIIESVYCPDYAKELEECLIEFAGKKYLEPGREVVFACGKGEDEDKYELEHLALYTVNSENQVRETNPGIVVAALSHSENPGFVYKANHRAMVLACKYMGHTGLRTYGYNEDFKYANRRVSEYFGYLIEEVECPENAQDFEECMVRLSDPGEKKAPGHELVLHCGESDGQDDGIGAISYNFGGLKTTVKVNKAKGKILIEDIIDYIFG